MSSTSKHENAKHKLDQLMAQHGMSEGQRRKALNALRSSNNISEDSDMPFNEDVRSVRESLVDVSNRLKEHQSERNEMSARLQVIEQQVAMRQAEGYSFGSAAHSIGNDAINSLGDDAGFQAAAEQVGRGMKPSAFTSRVNLDGSIRAALTNQDAGGEGDTAYPAQPERRGAVGPVRSPLRLLAALPHRPTGRDSVEFVQLTHTGDADIQAHEGDSKAKLDFSGTAKRAVIATIAGWTPASRQVLGDQQGLAQMINSVLRTRVLAKLEDQILNGVGEDGEIDGLLNQATAFAPGIGTTTADVVGESLVAQADAGYAPSLVILNPMDWFKLQLTRNSESDGRYIFGSPTVPVPPSLWNATVVTPPSMPAGMGLTVDAGYVTLLDREQVSVTVSNSHADYFVRNLVAILGELRAGLEVLDIGAVHKFELPASEEGEP